MDNDKNEQDSDTPESGQPRTWDRDEVRTDPPADPADTSRGEDATVPDWNEGQMAEQRADGTRTEGPTDAEIASSAGGLSGGGVNPGGGERWAERDDEPAED